MTRHSRLWLICGVLSGLLLFAIFLLIGSDILITGILCTAWVIGWAAVAAGGGFQTVTGWFAFFPLFYYLLLSLPLKIMVWEPAESRLLAPITTPVVTLLFFTGLFGAVVLCRLLKFGGRPVCSPGRAPGYYRWLTVCSYLAGTLAYFAAHFAGSGDEQSGGSGLANTLVEFQNLAIAAYIFHGWETGINIWKRPTLWFLILSGLFFGILTSEKTATSQPIVYVLVAVCGIYGMRSLKILGGFVAFVGLFGWVIYPIMHYARGVDGVRGGPLSERVSVMGSIVSSYATDPKFREYIKGEVDSYANRRVVTYLPESIGVFDRFLMIGNTDYLVSGIDHESKKDRFHDFELFALGIEVALPRAIYPAKPEVGSSEFLADVAGTRNRTKRANPTWGMPSELYYSFGFPGVLFGTFLLELIFLGIVNLWFGGQVRKSVWFCFLIVTMNQVNSCSAIDSLPILVGSLCVFSTVFSKLAVLLAAPGPRLRSLVTGS